ncbi:hypothetical protein JXJ21_01840 [candidate division KSB1 bacterium]|nr:hypothetical protein [candidate division KSB1 bacterium]
MRKKIINYKKEDGPVTLEVTSGYATHGSFILAYRKKDIGEEYIEFGANPKCLDDDSPDIYLIPVDEEKLEDYRVVIIGKYRPAEARNQLKVKYILRQGDRKIGDCDVEIDFDDTRQFKRNTQKFEFKHKSN